MSQILLNETASIATPAAGKVGVYADNTANPQVKFMDDAGNVRTLADNNNTLTMANKTFTAPNIGAATGTSLDVTDALTSTGGSNGAISLSMRATYEQAGPFSTGGHIFVVQNYPMVFWTNSLIRGRWTAAGNFESDNYTKLGSDAPAIKVKELTGTTGASQGADTEFEHGLSGNKIISITAVVRHNANGGIPPDYQKYPGYQYSVVFEANHVYLQLSAANSDNILSKPVSVFITYKE